jgi:hypothetical protein
MTQQLMEHSTAAGGQSSKHRESEVEKQYSFFQLAEPHCLYRLGTCSYLLVDANTLCKSMNLKALSV